MSKAMKLRAPVYSLAQKISMLPEAAKPQKFERDGRVAWRKPKFSLRQLADLKKQAVAEGLPWPLEEKPEHPPGESYYERKIFNCKGHKAERDRPDRQAMIAAKLANMPAEIEAYRKQRHESRQKTELQKILDWKKRK